MGDPKSETTVWKIYHDYGMYLSKTTDLTEDEIKAEVKKIDDIQKGHAFHLVPEGLVPVEFRKKKDDQ